MLSPRYATQRCSSLLRSHVRRTIWTQLLTSSLTRLHHPTTQLQYRHASLTGSINRGIVKAGRALKNAEKKRIREGALAPWERKDPEKATKAQRIARQRTQEDYERQKRLAFLKTGSENVAPGVDDTEFSTAFFPSEELESREGGAGEGTIGENSQHQRTAREKDPAQTEEYRRRERAKARARANGMLVDAPSGVPYTTAGSEFLYGTFAVLAALRAKKRQFYRLYIWCGEDGQLLDTDGESTEVVRLASDAKVEIVRVAGNWDKMLERMAEKRPHNGFVLEAGKIKRIHAKQLEVCVSKDSPVLVKLLPMAAEEKLALGMKPSEAVYEFRREPSSRSKRYPLLLFLDRITDTGNLGAIFRSAYFLGVDAIIMTSHGTAPLGPVAIKASAGAVEYMPVITVGNETEFMKLSQDNGWTFFAAAAEASPSSQRKTRQNARVEATNVIGAALDSAPCVLMLGNEGTGLRDMLLRQATYFVAVESERKDGLIDSLNVSVAAALLVQRFLGGDGKKFTSTAVQPRPDSQWKKRGTFAN